MIAHWAMNIHNTLITMKLRSWYHDIVYCDSLFVFFNKENASRNRESLLLQNLPGHPRHFWCADNYFLLLHHLAIWLFAIVSEPEHTPIVSWRWKQNHRARSNLWTSSKIHEASQRWRYPSCNWLSIPWLCWALRALGLPRGWSKS